MGYRSKQRGLNRGISNNCEAIKEMFNIFSHQGYANQKYFKIPSCIHQKAISISQLIAHAGKDLEYKEH